MSWLFSQALVEAYSEESCLDGELSARSNTRNTPPAFLYNDKMTGSFRRSRYGMTFAPLTDIRGEALLTWFLEDFLAKTLAQQENAPESTGKNRVCGLSLPESLAKLGPDGCWWKTPTTSEPVALGECSKIWPASGMMLRGECYPLKTVAPITKESACGLLPTPTAHNAQEGGYPAEGTRNTPTLGWIVGGKISPQFTEWMMGWPIGWTDLKPLEMDKFLLWPQTPSPN